MSINLLKGIRGLNETSSMEEILEILLFDVKRMACLDYEKVSKYNEKVSNVSLEYNNEDEYAKNIKNMERYKIAIDNKYYTTDFDCDKEPIVKELFLELLRKCKDVDSVEDVGGRTFLINNSIKLDTDTMNSFQTPFGNYIKILHPGYLDEYLRKYGIEKGTILYRNSYFIEECATWFKNQKDQTMYELFELFALLAHTFGNFFLIPEGYNCPRYQITKDIINLSFYDIVKKRSSDANFKWYTEHYEEMGYEPIVKYDVKNTPIEDNEAYPLFKPEKNIYPDKEGQIKDYVNNVCKIILLRGIKMMRDINLSINNNDKLDEFEEKIKNSNYVTEVFK